MTSLRLTLQNGKNKNGWPEIDGDSNAQHSPLRRWATPHASRSDR
jgi:hypothetical protein